MTKREQWEQTEVIIRRAKKQWEAMDWNDNWYGPTPDLALEALYESRKEYIEEEYAI